MRPVATRHADAALSASRSAIAGSPPEAPSTSRFCDPRDRFLDRLLGARARNTSSLRGADAPSRARSSPPRSSVRSDAARLRLLDAPSPTTPQDRRAPQDWSYPSPQSPSEAHARTDLPAHRHAHPSRAPPARPSRSPPRDRSHDALRAPLPRWPTSPQERRASPFRPWLSAARPGRLGPHFRQPLGRDFAKHSWQFVRPPLADAKPVEDRQAFSVRPELAVHSLRKA